MFEAEAVEQSESEQTVSDPLLRTGTVTCFFWHAGRLYAIYFRRYEILGIYRLI